MINIFPIITLFGFNINAPGIANPHPGYTYKSSIEIYCPINLINALDTYGDMMSIDGYVLFEGDFYCYSAQTYVCDIDSVYFYFGAYESVNGTTSYIDSFDANYSYGSESFSFDERDTILSFDSVIAFNNSYYFNDIHILGAHMGDFDVFTSMGSDFVNEYFYDGIYDGDYFLSTYKIDFASNSVLVDTFERTINNAISNVNPDTTAAYNQGYSDGEASGRVAGYDDGHRVGYDDGYSVGYSTGFYDGFSSDSTALTIFSGILAIGTLPINIFLSFFNFEVLGINFSELVSSMLSVCVCLIIIKKVFSTDTGA